MTSQNKIYALYKKGRWGYFHVTSMTFENLESAKLYYSKEFGYKEIAMPRLINLYDFKIKEICQKESTTPHEEEKKLTAQQW